MRLFPQAKKTPLWYVLKYGTIFIILMVVIGWFGRFGPLVSNDQHHQHANNNGRILSTTRHLLGVTSSSFNLLYANEKHVLNSTSISQDDQEDDNNISAGGSGGDSDGNSKICHKVSNYQLDQCQFVTKNCPNPMGGGMINYLWIRYCGLQQAPWLFFVLSVVWVLVLFYMLSNTAEENFCPALTEISRILRLSPDVAGVTFLALGNGAPDISSIVAGVFSGSTGFGIGEPIGAGTFVTSMVMSAVSLFSDAKVIPFPFLRDVIAYLISVVYVMVIVMGNGSINLWQSIMCLVIYALYVLFVIFSRTVITQYQKFKKRRSSINDSEEDESDDDDVGGWKNGKAPLFETQIDKISDLTDELKREIIEEQKHNVFGTVFFPKVGIYHRHKTTEQPTTTREQPPIFGRDELPSNSALIVKSINHSETLPIINKDQEEVPSNSVLIARGEKKEKKSGFNHSGSLIISEHFSLPSESTSILHSEDDEKTLVQKVKTTLSEGLEDFKEWIEWDEKSIFSKIFYVVFEGFTVVIRNMTIPKADPNDWSKPLACISMIFIPPFILFSVGSISLMLPNSNFPVAVLLLIVGIILSVIVFFTSRKSKPPVYHLFFVVLAFIMSILWIYIVANEMVDLLTSLGVIAQVSDAILSITVLSWGNSLSDIVADVIIARQGFVEMALGGVYGGPLLNLLIGLGISTTASNIMNPKPFQFEQNVTVYVSFFFLIASLLSSLIVVPLCKWKSPKIFGIFLGGLYLSYMIVSALVETKVLFSSN